MSTPIRRKNVFLYIIAFMMAHVAFFLNAHAQNLKGEWIKQIEASGDIRIGKDIVLDSEGNLYVPSRAKGNIMLEGGTAFSDDTENAVLFKIINAQPSILLMADDVSDESKSYFSAMRDVYINANDEIAFGGIFDQKFRFNQILVESPILGQHTYIGQLSADQQIRYLRYGNSSGTDNLSGVAIDAESNYIMSGQYNGDDFSFSFDNTSNTSPRGTSNFVIVKYSNEGEVLWKAYGYPSGGGSMESLVLDQEGNIYATGFFEGSFAFADAQGVSSPEIFSQGSGTDYFIVKLNANGSLAWLKGFGGNNNSDRSKNMTIGNNGEIYVVGRSNNPGNISGYDVFLAKHLDNGDQAWTVSAGSDKPALQDSDDAEPGKDYGNAVVTDHLGNVYMTGSFGGAATFENLAGEDVSITSASEEQRYVYVAKYSSEGNFLGEMHADGNFNYAENITVDRIGNIFIGGEYRGELTIDDNLTVTTSNDNSRRAIFISKINQAPVITSVENELGEAAVEFRAGDKIIIRGSYFDPASIKVQLGNVEISDVLVNDTEGTVLTATLPQDFATNDYELSVISHDLETKYLTQITVIGTNPPQFTLSTESIISDEDFEGERTSIIQPNTGTPPANYTFSPSLSSIDFADVAYVDANKTIRVNAKKDAYGSAVITVTATDQNNSNNTFSRTLAITINAVNDTPTVINSIDDLNVFQDSEPEILDISEVFSDVDDTELVYTLENSNVLLLTAELRGTMLHLIFAEGQTGEADITLTATDSGGASVSESFKVSVLPEGTPLPPIANAGANQTLEDTDNDGVEEVTLDGSASSDADGTIESYVWMENDAEIARGVSPTVSLTIGRHTITLVVTDDDGLTASSTVVVTVNSPSTVNTPPIVENNLGISLNIGATEVISQNALKVTDAESTPEALTYTLTQLPANGTLQREEEELALGDAFTQQDIDDDLIRYTNQNASATEDSFRFTVADENGSVTAETAFVITISQDQTPPVPSEELFPLALNRGVSDQLTLSIKVEDKESAIRSGRFGYTGLSSEEEIVLEEVSGNEGSYSVVLSSSELSAVNDPLGIRYRFEFTSSAPQPSVTTGETYWIHEDGTFKSTDSQVGPWREIGDKKSEELNLSSYNIIAFPFEPQQISEVLDTLGSPDNEKWRLFRHNPGTDTFAEYGIGNFSTNSSFAHSQGYFLIMRNREGIDFGGQIAEMKVRDENNSYPVAHELTLKKGWNLIGNPYPFAIDWQEVINHPSNSDLELLPLERLAGGTDYTQSAELKAFEGAFLNWQGENDAQIHIPFSARLNQNSQRADPQPSKGWELAITLEQGRFSSSRAGVGMRPEAKDGIDWYDALQVPKVQGQAEFLIDHPEHRMNRSVVPEQESYLWQAEIRGGKAGEEMLLDWAHSLPASLSQGLYLWDATHSRLIDMKEQFQYRLLMPKEGGLPLKIYYGTKEKLMEALDIQQFTAGLPYPNPVIHTTTLPMTIPQGNESNVWVTIYNHQGKHLNRYVFSKLSSGYHALEITLPENTSSGLYHYQIQIEGEKNKSFGGRIIKR